MVRAVFLDRDGVLNVRAPQHDYIKNFDEFYWNDGAKDLIKHINQKGLLAVVVTNQRGIARGMMTIEFVQSLHAQMNNDLEKTKTHIDAFYVCPHEEGCECRKPKPGLFLCAAKEHDIDLKESIMIGDSETDKQAADAAGCKATILIESDAIDIGYIMEQIDQLLVS